MNSVNYIFSKAAGIPVKLRVPRVGLVQVVVDRVSDRVPSQMLILLVSAVSDPMGHQFLLFLFVFRQRHLVHRLPCFIVLCMVRRAPFPLIKTVDRKYLVFSLIGNSANVRLQPRHRVVQIRLLVFVVLQNSFIPPLVLFNHMVLIVLLIV